jgi:hypothetical protein
MENENSLTARDAGGALILVALWIAGWMLVA